MATPVLVPAREATLPEEMYLELLKRALIRALVAESFERHTFQPTRPLFKSLYAGMKRLLALRSLELVRVTPSTADGYLESGHEAKNRVETAETMIGLRQLDNLEFCAQDVLRNNVPGDFLEAGVWRGGVPIFMRGILKAYKDEQWCVWVVDSFEGLPGPDPGKDSFGWTAGEMAVSIQEVKQNFARYSLLDDKVKFVKGFFKDTLPGPITRLSILRVDADLYESTIDVLNALYSKLSVGGYAIFDDYQNLPDCRRAIHEYRELHGVHHPIVPIDRRAVYWQKTC